jgi:hypothetical protein
MMYILLFGGSADTQLSFVPGESEVRRVIEDPQRRQEIIAILDTMKSSERVLLDAYEGRYADLAELSLRHDAGMEQFRVIAADLEQTRQGVQKEWLDSRFSLKQRLTRSEWENIYGR